jgi:hypothetical protein
MPKMSNRYTKVNPATIVVNGAIEAGCGAVLGGLSGLIGQYGVSFFSSVVANAAGSFGTFAALGAIAAPLVFLPQLLANYAIENNDYLNKHPYFKDFLKDTSRLVLQIGAVAAAAAMLSTPIGPTVICMMVIPAIYYLLSSICNAINALSDYDEKMNPAPGF